MTISQFHTAVSQPRFDRYLTACKEDQARALALYKANLILCQKMYAVNGIFEIILRNAIDRHFIKSRGQLWLEEAVSPGGYLDNDYCHDSFHAIHDAIHKLGELYSHDRLVAKLTFGFWTYQFAEREYVASGNSLLAIFPNRPPGTRQKIVFKNLFKINDLRNRIAHYEPICFKNHSHVVSTAQVQNRYSLITDMLHWLGYDPSFLLEDINGVQEAIEQIHSI